MSRKIECLEKVAAFFVLIGVVAFSAPALSKAAPTSPPWLPPQKKSTAAAPFTAANEAEKTLIDSSAIDPHTKPCDDFYQYACGGWIKNFRLPEDDASYTRSFDVISNRNLEIENEILKAYAANDYKLPAKYAGKLGQFYATCMNTEKVEQETPGYISQALSRIDALTEKNLLAPLVADLHMEGVNVLFGFGAESDAKDSNQKIAEFTQGGLGLPNKNYYLEEKNAETRAHYREHIVHIFKLAGTSESSAPSEADTVMRIEASLAQASLGPEESTDPRLTYNPTNLADLAAKLRNFDVDRYLKKLGVPTDGKINVSAPKFVDALNGLLETTPLDDIKVYLKWHVLNAASPYLSEAFRKENFAFYGAYLSGTKKMSERWKHCVSTTESAMGEALGEAYVNKEFGADGKIRAQEMIQKIRVAFRNNLSQVDWLDDATKARAAEKLAKIISKIGYPEKFRAYDGLVVAQSYIENVKTATRFEARRQLATIGKPVDKSLWLMNPQAVNAYYNASWNEIVFPAGILQSPFFSREASDGANFGAIGMVMGHELTHGFDSSGRKYDGDGNLVDWWSKKSSEAFDSKARCMVEQYNKYEVIPGVFINGKLTLTENIADSGGIKLAHQAFMALANSRPPAPEVDGFDEHKQFFIAFAQAWCTVETPEVTKLLAQTDAHSNAKYRINGSLANTPAFAETFNCPAEAPMAPKNRCSLW